MHAQRRACLALQTPRTPCSWPKYSTNPCAGSIPGSFRRRGGESSGRPSQWFHSSIDIHLPIDNRRSSRCATGSAQHGASADSRSDTGKRDTVRTYEPRTQHTPAEDTRMIRRTCPRHPPEDIRIPIRLQGRRGVSARLRAVQRASRRDSTNTKVRRIAAVAAGALDSDNSTGGYYRAHHHDSAGWIIPLQDCEYTAH